MQVAGLATFALFSLLQDDNESSKHVIANTNTARKPFQVSLLYVPFANSLGPEKN
jgi:hypothetical protein